MPLVLDRAASDESRKLVESHMTSCDECRKQYNAMKADLPKEVRSVYEAEQKQLMDAFKATKRKRRQRRVLFFGLALVLCFVATFGGLFAYHQLYENSSVPIDNALYTVNLYQLADGRINVTLTMADVAFNHMSQQSSYIEGIQYVTLCTTPMHSTSKASSTKYNIMHLDQGEGKTLKEIRQGTPNNYIVVWKEGDVIPAASQEMEAYYLLQNQYFAWFDQQPSTPDGKLLCNQGEYALWDNRLDAAQAAVPEWK